MAQHRAVKVRIVEIKQGVGVGDSLLKPAGNRFASCQIPDANRFVADGPGKQHHLDTFRISVRAVRDGYLAVGFQVAPENGFRHGLNRC